MGRRSGVLVAMWLLAAAALGVEADPKGNLPFTLRRRVKQPNGGHAVREEKATWAARETALIICDMWDQHWCKGATSRVAEMAPRMNQFVAAVRDRGVLVVHAPSGCLGPYKDHPARLRAQSAPTARNLPKDIGGWAGTLPSEAAHPWPIDQSDGGCDDQPQCPQGGPWRRQIAALTIEDADAISDSGVEIWNLFEQRGIRNVLLVGVHTNMCVIGRPFGLRNMVRCGKSVALVRDLTDTMYNSRKAPFVSHCRGTDLIVEHIEIGVCPTLTSDQLLGGEPFRFKEDIPAPKAVAPAGPHVVLVIGEEHGYDAPTSLRELAKDLQDGHGMRCTVLQFTDYTRIIGLEALRTADLAVFYIRRRLLPADQMQIIKDYLAAGKPLIAFRTSSHSFQADGSKPTGGAVRWDNFDQEVLGCHYAGHSTGDSEVRAVPDAAKHPILTGVGDGPCRLKETLYRSRPLTAACEPLMMGKSLGTQMPDEPVAWTTTYNGGRVFYTSMGARTTFQERWFQQMVLNAVHWALGRPAPMSGKGEAAGKTAPK